MTAQLATSPVQHARPQCPKHPDVVAEGSCKRCGDYLCTKCIAIDSGASYWCADCAALEERSTRRGRRIVAAVCLIAYAQISFDTVYSLYEGTLGAGQILRPILWGWILWNVYKCRSWARKLFLVFVAFTIVRILLRVAEDPFVIADAVWFTALGATILFAPSVKAYFRAPRSFADLIQS